VLPVGPYLWQSNTFATGYSDFFAFCDAVEVTLSIIIDRFRPNRADYHYYRTSRLAQQLSLGWKVSACIRLLWVMRTGSTQPHFLAVSEHCITFQSETRSLSAFADCASYGYWTDKWSVACFDTHNASSPLFTDISVRNGVDRQWQWFLCNEPFFWWQE
jgi:hypothetical protein